MKQPLEWSIGALNMPKVWTDRLDSNFFFGITLRGSTGKKLKKFSGAFRRTDVVRPKNTVGSSETSYFVEKCLR